MLEFNLNSILELVGEICWAAKELNIVAFWVILSFTNGTARPCSFTKEQFASINSPCPLKVKDNPSNVSRWGSPMPAAIENYIFFLNITIKNCITILASIYLLFVYPFLLITSKINITNRYMSPLQFDMSMGRIKIISSYMCSHKKNIDKMSSKWLPFNHLYFKKIYILHATALQNALFL